METKTRRRLQLFGTASFLIASVGGYHNGHTFLAGLALGLAVGMLWHVVQGER